jgi:hypothetical protein
MHEHHFSGSSYDFRGRWWTKIPIILRGNISDAGHNVSGRITFSIKAESWHNDNRRRSN